MPPARRLLLCVCEVWAGEAGVSGYFLGMPGGPSKLVEPNAHPYVSGP